MSATMIKLNDGSYIQNHFGKYEANLCFVLSKDKVEFKRVPKKELTTSELAEVENHLRGLDPIEIEVRFPSTKLSQLQIQFEGDDEYKECYFVHNFEDGISDNNMMMKFVKTHEYRRDIRNDDEIRSFNDLIDFCQKVDEMHGCGNKLTNKVLTSMNSYKMLTAVFELEAPCVADVQKHISPVDLNLERGNLSIIYGRYFVSKKGTNCFEVDPNGPHKLIEDAWGGAFDSYRGNTITGLTDALYERRAVSNGGGKGYDYTILPRDWVNVVSIDDI